MLGSQLSRSQLGLGLGFGAWLAGLGFPQKYLSIIVDIIHLYILNPFMWLQRGGGWGLDFKQDILYIYSKGGPSLGVVHRYIKCNFKKKRGKQSRRPALLAIPPFGHTRSFVVGFYPRRWVLPLRRWVGLTLRRWALPFVIVFYALHRWVYPFTVWFYPSLLGSTS